MASRERGPVVLDLQGFKDNDNQFILKEVCVVEVNTSQLLLHHIACPPYDRDQLNQERLRESFWATKHCHGLQWSEGDMPYHVLIDQLMYCLHNRDIVYVMGPEKKEFVQRNLRLTSSTVMNIVDLAEVGCASIASLKTLMSATSFRCNRHLTPQSRCSLQNAFNLCRWVYMSMPKRQTPPQPFIGRDEVDCSSCSCNLPL